VDIKAKPDIVTTKMPYAIRRPEGLPRGPITYVPDLGDNRKDLTDPFRIRVVPPSYQDMGGISAMAPEDVDESHVIEDEDGKKRLNGAAAVSAGEQLFELYISKSCPEVWAGQFEDAKTGEILEPKDGPALLDALKRTFAEPALEAITDIGNACMDMHRLRQGDWDFLKSSQP